MQYQVRSEGLYYVGECIHNGKVLGTFRAFGYAKALDGIQTLMACTVWAG